MKSFHETRGRLIAVYYTFIEGTVDRMVARGFTPNAITLASLGVSILSALCYAFGLIFPGGLLLLFSGTLDTMDGAVARRSGQSSRFGALLDSTLDRVAEFFVFFGLLVYYLGTWIFFAALLAMMGSIMVSYVKARGESLGSIRIVGLMQRPERLLVLAAGSLLNTPLKIVCSGSPDCILSASIVLLALLTNVTVIHRLMACKKDFETKG